MSYLNRKQRRMIAAFRMRRERADESWPWLEELLAHAKRNGSRMCLRWDGYDDGERYQVTLAGRQLLDRRPDTAPKRPD